jgi:hypothetical protein
VTYFVWQQKLPLKFSVLLQKKMYFLQTPEKSRCNKLRVISRTQSLRFNWIQTTVIKREKANEKIEEKIKFIVALFLYFFSIKSQGFSLHIESSIQQPLFSAVFVRRIVESTNLRTFTVMKTIVRIQDIGSLFYSINSSNIIIF